MTTSPVLLWLRNDLRFGDNPAMRAALATAAPVICVYVLDDESAGAMKMGAAQRWWLHHSLTAFREDLETRGGALILRRGDARTVIPQLAEETGASHVFWTRRYMQWQTDVDSDIKQALKNAGREAKSCNGSLLYEPWELETKSWTPFRVFTPFWKALQARGDIRAELPRTDKLEAPSSVPESDRLEDWQLLPASPDWASGFAPVWSPGEKGARARFKDWLKDGASQYGELRDRPDIEATSRLSPHLHFGEISPVTIWHDVRSAVAAGHIPEKEAHKFLSEIAWREFSFHLLYYNPQMVIEPLQEKFSRYKWNTDKKALAAWQKSETGYPIVDAGMRQLWQTGWMHNRVRMIVASFLIKDLHIDWREGMAWFWDTLIDADPANNTASWQWVAGCGADAAPFFRIFNPTTQGQKFDPEGSYVRQFVPELKNLSAKHIHEPAAAPASVLEEAGIRLGTDYPAPITDHKIARQTALSRYQDIK